jgi:hypothetical protein
VTSQKLMEMGQRQRPGFSCRNLPRYRAINIEQLLDAEFTGKFFIDGTYLSSKS